MPAGMRVATSPLAAGMDEAMLGVDSLNPTGTRGLHPADGGFIELLVGTPSFEDRRTAELTAPILSPPAMTSRELDRSAAAVPRLLPLAPLSLTGAAQRPNSVGSAGRTVPMSHRGAALAARRSML